jgi:Tol biopolymer transport system component
VRLAARSPVVLIATAALVAGSLVLPARSRGDVVTAGPVQRLSVAGGGKAANGDSSAAVIAARNPSVTAFVSAAQNLGTAAERTDAFVNDNGKIVRLAGALPDNWAQTGPSRSPSLSADGRYAAFVAVATDNNAPPASTPPQPGGEVFVRDLTVPKAVHIGVDGLDAQTLTISPDGRYVAFTAPASPSTSQTGPGEPDVIKIADVTTGEVKDLLDQTESPLRGHDPVLADGATALAFTTTQPIPLGGDDTNATPDVYLLSGQAPPPGAPPASIMTVSLSDQRLQRISVGPGGRQADGPSRAPSISADGNLVAFESFATNLVDDDTNGTADIFLRDIKAGTTTLVSRTSGGVIGNGPSTAPSLALDGRYVAFASAAGNLVANDTNGADPTNATQTNFELIDANGNSTYATAVTPEGGPPVTRVRATFPRGVAPAVGIRVDRGAVIDEQVQPLTVFDGRSNANPLGTVGRQGTTAIAGNTVLTTARPDLVSITLASAETNPPQGTLVDFCFDANLDSVGDQSRFHLHGYDSAVFYTADGGVVKSPDDQKCARVGFGTFAHAFTPDDYPVGVVDADAVTGAGSGNTAASLGVTTQVSGVAQTLRPPARRGLTFRAVAAGPLADVTTAPEVTSVQPDQNNADTLLFDFDQEVVYTGQGSAGFFRSDGSYFSSTNIVLNNSREIRVTFPQSVETVAGAARYFIDHNVVGGRTVGLGPPPTDREGNPSQGGPSGDQNGSTSSPNLTDATAIPNSTPATDMSFELTFDRNFSSPVPSKFAFYTEDGTRFLASSAVPESDKRKVKVTAPVGLFVNPVLMVTAEPGAVTGTNDDPPDTTGTSTNLPETNPASTAGSVVLNSLPSPRSGRTDGPDLVPDPATPAFDPATNSVLFTFDEPVRIDGVQLSPPSPAVAPIPKDIFERDLVTGSTGRASLGADGSEANGDSGAPSITADGRYVAFDSAATNLLPGDDPNVRDIFRRDMLTARVDPGLLDFSGPVAIGSRSATRSITVTNDEFGPLRYGGSAITGNDFTVVDDGCRNKVLNPTETCRVGVVFSPRNAGALTSTLTVSTDDLASPHRVSLTGIAEGPPGPGAFTPTLAVSPGVGPGGTVASVSGQGYRPDIALRLQWGPDPTLAAGPVPIGSTTVLATDGQGRFGPVPILVFHHDLLGPRVVQTSGTLPDATATAPFLAVQSTVEPSGKDVVSLVRQVQLLGRR